MIYKFKSKATGDLIMLEENGRKLLTIIGKADTDSLKKGILLPQDMPAAMIALQKAIAQEDIRLLDEAKTAADAENPSPQGGNQSICLRQRSLPFIRMMERCCAEKKEIVWGV